MSEGIPYISPVWLQRLEFGLMITPTFMVIKSSFQHWVHGELIHTTNLHSFRRQVVITRYGQLSSQSKQNCFRVFCQLSRAVTGAPVFGTFRHGQIWWFCAVSCSTSDSMSQMSCICWCQRNYRNVKELFFCHNNGCLNYLSGNTSRKT